MKLFWTVFYFAVLCSLFLMGCNPVNQLVEPTSVPERAATVIEGEGTDILARLNHPPREIDKSQIPPVNLDNHIVPLEEIYFDTFRSYDRIVPLDQADDRMIRNLRDAIPPIYNPQFVSAADAKVKDNDLVLGYVQADVAVAYPIKILNWHEIVIHDIDGIPIMATY